MKNKYLDKLEYTKILNKLSNYAHTYIGKNMCKNLIPSNNKENVKKSLAETEEALNILYRCNTPSISEIADNTIIRNTFYKINFRINKYFKNGR